MNTVMLDEIITKKLSQWAQRGLDDGLIARSVREVKKEKRPFGIKQKASKKISQNSISKQLSLF
ncbi:hypothetical protein [uncultured Eudoraea sp.]|uniref:hypothetical protein n=1 Tax=uncultured Eudoraea sp. TaxID=1035614 RepID=UPI0026316701|nr:hypothetical protein [uncultured Eudoraea sp.]MBT8181405.1 hypothetical protein [Eudoraea sp.]MBT8292706.1 hypothetical protein [Eudoraea sp.]